MMNRRLIGPAVLICLPLIAFGILSVYFLGDKVPQLAAQHRKEEALAYRQVALRLWETPEEAETFGAREKGWRQTGRVGSRREGFVPWGHVAEGPVERVWIGSPRFVCSVCVPREPTLDLSTFFAWCAGGVLLSFLVLTVLCLRFFIRYASDRDAFVAATVHDLVTPLVGLRRLIGVDAEESRNLVERMVRLVENLRTFLNRAGRRADPSFENFDVQDALASAYRIFREDFREIFEGRDVPVLVSGTSYVCADRLMTEQILWNLYANELKYAAPEGPVEVRLTEKDGGVRVAFCSSAGGLSASERRHLFDRYYRTKSARRSGKGGFGIGLCTAREFARAMGGDLTVEPNLPTGNVFTLALKKGLCLVVTGLALTAPATTIHRSFRNGYPVGVRTQTATVLTVSQPSTAMEKALWKILPPEKLNEMAGFFGPVTKKYLPAFRRFGRAYSTRTDKPAVIAEFLPTAEKALDEARKMRVPAKYEQQKTDYIRLFEAAIFSARVVAKFQ